MKKEEQSRRENSAAPVNTQTKTPAPGAMPDVEECRKAIRGAVAQIDDLLAESDCDTDKMQLLCIRQHLSPLNDYWKTWLLENATTPSPPFPEPDGQLHYHCVVTLSQMFQRVETLIKREERRPKMSPRLRRLVVELKNIKDMLITLMCHESDPRILHPLEAEKNRLVKPFGPVKPTAEVDSARRHIKNVWFQSCPKPLDDTVSILYCLRSCFAHNPYLLTESQAIMALHEGSNALTELENRCGKEDAGATAAEKWLVKQLGTVPERRFTPMMEVINEAVPLLRENPKTAALADVFNKMDWGVNVLLDVEQYVNAL